MSKTKELYMEVEMYGSMDAYVEHMRRLNKIEQQEYIVNKIEEGKTTPTINDLDNLFSCADETSIDEDDLLELEDDGTDLLDFDFTITEFKIDEDDKANS